MSCVSSVGVSERIDVSHDCAEDALKTSASMFGNDVKNAKTKREDFWKE